MSATAAPPYVSLLDKLRDLATTIAHEGGHLVSSAEIPGLLAALVHYTEHGDELLRQAAFGYQAGIEPVLTPDRPEGWAPPVQYEDPMQQEIARLRGELDALRAGKPDPRQAYVDDLRAQLAAQSASNATPEPAAPEPAAPEVPDFVREIERQQQEAAARSAVLNPEGGGVEITTAEGDAVTTTEATVEPSRDALSETGDNA